MSEAVLCCIGRRRLLCSAHAVGRGGLWAQAVAQHRHKALLMQPHSCTCWQQVELSTVTAVFLHRLRTEQWLSSSFKKGRGRPAGGDGGEGKEADGEPPRSPRGGGAASVRHGLVPKGGARSGQGSPVVLKGGRSRFQDEAGEEEEEEEDGEPGGGLRVVGSRGATRLRL